MIEITVKKKQDIYNGLCVKGHAGFGKYGNDIICAAVSVLVINTINSIETFTEDVFVLNTDEVSGLIEFEVVSVLSSETRLLLDSLLLGLEGIVSDYGEAYVRLRR